MGDVIDFKSRNKISEELDMVLTQDPQTQIEKGIVSLWQSLGGFDIELAEFDYLMVFMAFSDICFTELERDNMSILDDDKIVVQPALHTKLKGIIDAIKATTPANDE
jgi:hypothetical protein